MARLGAQQTLAGSCLGRNERVWPYGVTRAVIVTRGRARLGSGEWPTAGDPPTGLKTADHG
jgi:hypothetical protein